MERSVRTKLYLEWFFFNFGASLLRLFTLLIRLSRRRYGREFCEAGCDDGAALGRATPIAWTENQIEQTCAFRKLTE